MPEKAAEREGVLSPQFFSEKRYDIISLAIFEENCGPVGLPGKAVGKHDIISLAIFEENCGSAGPPGKAAGKHDIISLAIFEENCGPVGPPGKAADKHGIIVGNNLKKPAGLAAVLSEIYQIKRRKMHFVYTKRDPF